MTGWDGFSVKGKRMCRYGALICTATAVKQRSDPAPADTSRRSAITPSGMERSNIPRKNRERSEAVGRQRSAPPLPTPVGGLPLCGVIGNLPHRHRAKVRAKVAFCKGGHKGAGFVILRRATVYDCTRSGFVILRRDKPLGAPAARREICRNFARLSTKDVRRRYLIALCRCSYSC